MAAFLLALLGSTVAALVIALMLRLGKAGPLDLPNHRSLHAAPVPRSGGIGIMAGVAAGGFIATPAMALALAVAFLAGLSWWDDRRSLPVALRFAGHFVAAGILVYSGVSPDWGIWGAPLFLLAVVWMTNLYNFMDGANGLAGGMTVFGFAAYAVAGAMSGQTGLALWAACIAGSALGFLFFNFDPARIFMGDVGSIPLGFLAGGLGLEGVRQEAWPVWFPLLVFAPFIADATVTLAKRALRGEKVWQAHREHYYQRLIRSGWSHRRLALAAYLLMFVTAGSACLLILAPSVLQVLVIAAFGVIYVLLMRAIDRQAAGISGKT